MGRRARWRRFLSGGGQGGGDWGLRMGISLEPNRSAEPNTTGTEPTEPSTVPPSRWKLSMGPPGAIGHG
eukprot:9161221-Alexandrium_andersonii.AAC.1